MAKETINKTKRQCTEWATCSMIDTSDKGLISKMYKELIKTQHTHKKNPIPFINRQRTWILLQRGQTDSQQAYEKMLNVANHQRNAN